MPPPDGREFGKYQLLERIATGGMAEIYRARMTAAAGVTKPVAIKKILPSFAGHRDFVSLFINEARIAVGLSHGNIVQVFDFGQVDGEYFLAMEWVHGHALSRVLRRARERGLSALPPALALMIASEMLKGLAYAHTRLDETGRPLGIVHRDVSPQNVLVGYEGQVKLSDFGIARARRAGRLHEGGLSPGKYLYFAPEQARGQEPDARADLFAAGAVLYELLCGRRPFEGALADVLPRLAAGDFPRPRAVHPKLPAALESILLTALAPEPAQRYPTTQAFHEAVAKYLHAEVPDFSPHALAHFMDYLFEPERVAQGHPVQLPRDFLARLARWSQELPEGPGAPGREPSFAWDTADAPAPSGEDDEPITQPLPGAAEPTGRLTPPLPAAPAPTGRITQPLPAISSPPAPARRPTPAPTERITQRLPTVQPSAPPPSPPGLLGRVLPEGPRRMTPRRRLLLALLPLAVALLAGAFLVTLEDVRHFTVELTSTPPGAHVLVNGQGGSTRTPALLTQLEAEREHLIEVRLPGMRPWSQRVRAERGDTLAVHARLQPDHPPEPAARLPPLPHEGRYPLSGFNVSAANHALHVPSSHAARLGLDPGKSYVVSTPGQAHSPLAAEPPSPASDVVYLLTGGTRLTARESFGLVGPTPTLVRHASALYLFVLGAPGERGHIEVHVREEESGAVTIVHVDASDNAVALPPQARFTLRGLDPAATYELLVRETEAPARTHGRQGPPVGQVLCLRGGADAGQDDETRGAAQVLEVGHPYRVTGAAWVHFTFPDDALDDNSGALTVDVTPVPAPRPPSRPGLPGRG